MIRKLLIAVAAALLLFIVFQLITFPRVGKLKTENPETTAFMERRQEELREAGRDDTLRQTWVSYDQISPHLRSAVIVSEDSRFYDHKGVDTEELEKVLREAVEKRELGRGGSTITQQLAKNLYLSPSRSPLRKLKEIAIAHRMEQVLSKKRILELYLNLVEFGETVYGAEAAARHYFGTSAASLTPSQAALLAGALPNPRKMNPGNPGPYLQSRRDIIVSRMRRWGYMAERSVATAPQESAPAETEEATDELPEIIDESEEQDDSETPPEDPFNEDQPLPADFVPVEPAPDQSPPEEAPPSELPPGGPEGDTPVPADPPGGSRWSGNEVSS